MHFDYIILFYGITFGIVLMTIVYTLIRYIYSKEIFYISYCFMQIFSLIYIAQYSGFWNILNTWKDLSLTFASLSALVFAINYFQGKFIPVMKNYKELLFNTLLINIVLLSSFYHYMLFEYLPYTIIYGILFISIVFNFKNSFKPTLIYVFGWSLFCFILFIFDFKNYYEQKGFMDLVLLAFAIEAILFTISVSYKYNDLKQEKKEYENMLLQQSKLAKSGEMIANITHQFRQPLNNLSYILINLKKKFVKNELEKEYFEKKITQANQQIEFLSKTINDFKEFYIPSKKREQFLVKEVISNVQTIFEEDLKKHNIVLNVDFKTNDDIKIFGIKNELAQVFLAILSNSRDVLKNIEKPEILIEVSASSAEVTISILNNGPKINQKDITKLFDPYFSTKKEGSGLGLFLSKQIIEESFNGKIEVSNNNERVCFSLIIEKDIN
ncbi:HAMP domain-containing sensor histidine kinase [Halarcobacter sp.]|uniref:HAMP domain-containing sensor histidine kinase n=1 Tax=Halarcobacter sp. TaxID=2321133 RepID=UPI002AAB9F83|nr:HAMP domain-containing sensor histidine kinase [Halarcobacter sp.]